MKKLNVGEFVLLSLEKYPELKPYFPTEYQEIPAKILSDNDYYVTLMATSFHGQKILFEMLWEELLPEYMTNEIAKDLLGKEY